MRIFGADAGGVAGVDLPFERGRDEDVDGQFEEGGVR